tara:strand:- start:7479 stop:8606 length:1128 start_codon:yes stop_codon:yes gene_type:complete
MTLNHFRYLLVLCFFHLTINAQFEFDGQLLGQTNFGLENKGSKFIGARYLPSLNLKKKVDSLFSFAFQISGNFDVTQFLTTDEDNQSSSNIAPYRVWFRYQVGNWEFRVGLQKIDFGVAQLLRPIQWFNQIDPRDPLGLTNGVNGLLIRHYFKNNSNLWLWGLYGNDKQRGFDALPTIKDIPEFGGRFQTFVPKGEAAISYHYRQAGGNSSLGIDTFQNPEHRIGFDTKLDLGFGVWTEATFIHKTENIGLLTNQFLLNIGIDYTFGIGKGLTVSKEYLFSKYSDNQLNNSISSGVSALSFNYPLSFFSSLSALVYQQWNNDKQTFMINYQHQYNNLSGYFIFYYNPDSIQGIQQNDIFRSFAGPGVQLLLVYNH